MNTVTVKYLQHQISLLEFDMRAASGKDIKLVLEHGSSYTQWHVQVESSRHNIISGKTKRELRDKISAALEVTWQITKGKAKE